VRVNNAMAASPGGSRNSTTGVRTKRRSRRGTIRDRGEEWKKVLAYDGHERISAAMQGGEMGLGSRVGGKGRKEKDIGRVVVEKGNGKQLCRDVRKKKN